ncbi:hypothetical protein CALVIDRAFT_538109 [Calocera viscosa TUFC12733]|uniref:Uncharacterized protein n=1 Tax=Calocera viscosa (strain TUFC12733) TaxID=1330018 RepID=A0A167L4Q2_CALVF|nr:hypothetical protein CALVIDRAFT_538109 [Calocera viscosa TUFC12733]
MFSLIHVRTSIARSLSFSTRYVPGATALLRTRAYSAKAAGAPKAKLESSAIRAANALLENGAPKPEKDFAEFTNLELRVWKTETMEALNMPATEFQLGKAKAMIADGAPNGDQVRDDMPFREMRVWLSKAKAAMGNWNYGDRMQLAAGRELPASRRDVRRARELATTAGLTPPYNQDSTTLQRGEVLDFIRLCKDELVRQGRPAYVPNPEQRALPATFNEREWLKRRDVRLPEEATRGEASDRIAELMAAEKAQTEQAEAAAQREGA